MLFTFFFLFIELKFVNGVENNNNIESFIHKFSSHGASPHNSFFSLKCAHAGCVNMKKKRKKRAQTHDMAYFFSFFYEFMNERRR